MNTNKRGPKPSVKDGDVFRTNEGCDIVVVKYHTKRNIVIQFQDEHRHECRVEACQIKRGNIKNPYHKSVYGVGFYGVGANTGHVNGVKTRAYAIWNSMIQRCYCPKTLERIPVYKDCSVDINWHNFQNFADWYYQQPNSGKKGFDLDKDFITPNNRVYGPKTCSLVPKQVNNLFTGEKKNGLPVGVCRRYKKYIVLINDINKESTEFGVYPTVEEAREVYVKEKRKIVVEVANKYRDQLHPQVYHNLINWEL